MSSLKTTLTVFTCDAIQQCYKQQIIIFFLYKFSIKVERHKEALCAQLYHADHIGRETCN